VRGDGCVGEGEGDGSKWVNSVRSPLWVRTRIELVRTPGRLTKANSGDRARMGSEAVRERSTDEGT
jgi:hypothetical protein